MIYVLILEELKGHQEALTLAQASLENLHREYNLPKQKTISPEGLFSHLLIFVLVLPKAVFHTYYLWCPSVEMCCYRSLTEYCVVIFDHGA